MGTVDDGDLLDHLDRAIDTVCGAELDLLDEAGLTDRLDRLHRAHARLGAERARLTATIEQRHTSPIEDPRQQERTRQQLRRDIANRTNQPPARTTLDAQAGLSATEHPTTGHAFTDGRISAEHVRLIAEVLDVIIDPDERDRLEHDLLTRAATTPPAPFGRYTRELLARHAPVSVTLREQRQHRDRRIHATPTPDGGLTLSGIVYGTAAETIRTALDAYRRPDISGELRTPPQRTADALEQLCATALRTGDAPARHGARPQVLITVTTDQLDLGDNGLAHLASGEPTTLGRLRHLTDDCTWSRIILAPDSTPLEASIGVRTVPHGLWRALLARDNGCTWPGCDAPPAWCDVAHGADPFAAGGQLSPDNAALLCRRHHRRFDHGNYHIHINGNHIHYQRVRDDDHTAAPQAPDHARGQDRSNRTNPTVLDQTTRPPEPQPPGPTTRPPHRPMAIGTSADHPRAPEPAIAPVPKPVAGRDDRNRRRGASRRRTPPVEQTPLPGFHGGADDP